jgi:hypothetical protein
MAAPTYEITQEWIVKGDGVEKRFSTEADASAWVANQQMLARAADKFGEWDPSNRSDRI